MTPSTMRRGLPLWVITVLVGAALALAVIATSGSSPAQAATALSISKTIHPRVVTVGERQTYIIKITNNTGHRVRGVKMWDPLPKKVRFIRASTSLRKPGSCEFVRSSRTVWCGPYTLTRGQRFTVKIYVKTTKVGRYVNTAYVSHRTAGFRTASVSSDSAHHRAVKDDGGS